MKTFENMNQLFSKLDELKIVFGKGIKLIPIIQSLIDFMKEIVPLINNLTQSIEESNSKIPKATNQITKVTEATELATTEILDIVDKMSADISDTAEMLKKVMERDKKKSEILQKIKAAIPADSKIEELFNEYEKLEKNKIALNTIGESLQKIKADAYNITMSLQVQDITSQQLAAVKHLIGSVQMKLVSLNNNLIEANLDNIELKLTSEHSFDANADYTKSPERQEMADSIITSHNSTSQTEVDKLFS
ncbi:MAG TPA: protein phosphatase CheZ [Ignavibacteriaceae bacterium]|nr:protein phosphatase CheZ [Ignavibacteriaceae bacterium]